MKMTEKLRKRPSLTIEADRILSPRHGKRLSLTAEAECMLSSPLVMTNRMEIITHVLKKKELERSQRDIDKLLKELLKNDFFNDVKAKRPHEVLVDLAKKLEYEHF